MDNQYPNGQNNPNQFGSTAEGGSGSSYQAAYGAQPAQSSVPTQPAPSHIPTSNAGSTHVGASAPDAGAQAFQTNHYSSTGTAQHAQVAPGPVSQPKGKSGGKIFLIAFAGALVACIFAFGVMGVYESQMGNSGVNVTLGSSEAGSVEAVDAEATLAEAVAEKCMPSVVSIDVYANTSSTGSSSIYDYLYGDGANGSGSGNGLTEAGLGSGVVLSEDGYIITNNHVVSGGTAFRVTIEGDTYDAELVGQDASSDVAVLKVDGSGFKPITIADSDDIKIGEWVMAIGSPFGLEQSVSTGIVSATSRSQIMDSSAYGTTGDVTIYPNMIQTDAAINPGNSGGALVNAEGQLIGINTLITSYSGNYSGVGFAIPVNYAVNLAQSIIAGEEPTHAYLGVNLTTINASSAERYGFSVDEGAYISGVVESSPAATAGLKVGDIVTSFDDKAVTSASDLMLDVRTKTPGDTVKVVVNREGETMEFDVTLGSAPNSSTASGSDNSAQNNPNAQNGDSGSRSGGSGNTSPLEDLFRQFGN